LERDFDGDVDVFGAFAEGGVLFAQVLVDLWLKDRKGRVEWRKKKVRRGTGVEMIEDKVGRLGVFRFVWQLANLRAVFLPAPRPAPSFSRPRFAPISRRRPTASFLFNRTFM
jgi:hypothetical protein